MIEGAGDPGLYDWVPPGARKPVVWPGGKTVAVWVAPNLEYYEIDPPPHPRRKAWGRPHPDVVGYSHRDHSNRVSHWRMADVMTRNGFPGSVSLSVALCQHHPEVVEDARQRGWEFFSHGIYNTRYAYDMAEVQERAIIEDSIRTFEPRLQGVRVIPLAGPEGAKPIDRRVRFEIEAVLVVAPLKEPILLASSLDTSSGEFAVEAVA